ncbi:hypothetical protein PYW07_009149 [Mythimna separata]|uniref:ARID domain-containing protein n=1 Tax=Mythimna separata TaxID=271217 RepID=A0AAD7YB16_MYTSE|nr:hypothetical protein PYW07_009149 [Mythimna separata]
MHQYVPRLFNRWGPATIEYAAIKMCLYNQNITWTRPPCLDCVEVDLPKLYHIVQRFGGLETVSNKKRWAKSAETGAALSFGGSLEAGFPCRCFATAVSFTGFEVRALTESLLLLHPLLEPPLLLHPLLEPLLRPCFIPPF